MPNTDKVDYLIRCRCCGERRRPGERSTTTCQFCIDECTNEGCVGTSWVPVPADDNERSDV